MTKQCREELQCLSIILAVAILFAGVLLYNYVGVDMDKAIGTALPQQKSYVMHSIFKTIEEPVAVDPMLVRSQKPFFDLTEKVDAETPPKYPYNYALANSGTFSLELQELLFMACDEFDVPYELALAVVWKETEYRNIMGDGGRSYGYMQIQKKWHYDRMQRLGVTDLMDPQGNFRVGCSLLRYNYEYSGTWERALTMYNTGSPGKSGYANRVIAKWEELR